MTTTYKKSLIVIVISKISDTTYAMLHTMNVIEYFSTRPGSMASTLIRKSRVLNIEGVTSNGTLRRCQCQDVKCVSGIVKDGTTKIANTISKSK